VHADQAQPTACDQKERVEKIKAEVKEIDWEIWDTANEIAQDWKNANTNRMNAKTNRFSAEVKQNMDKLLLHYQPKFFEAKLDI
jgi:hypothetical protein